MHYWIHVLQWNLTIISLPTLSLTFIYLGSRLLSFTALPCPPKKLFSKPLFSWKLSLSHKVFIFWPRLTRFWKKAAKTFRFVSGCFIFSLFSLFWPFLPFDISIYSGPKFDSWYTGPKTHLYFVLIAVGLKLLLPLWLCFYLTLFYL